MEEFDDFNFQDSLNPALFDVDTHQLYSNVRERLMLIATSFLQHMKIKLEPVDVVMVGSSANYNWSKFSDVDIHIIVNFADLDENHELVQDYFKMKKSEWNEKHHVKVKGFDTELYLQDIYEINISGGIYSIENDKWIQEPSKDKHEIDKALLKIKVDDMNQQIDELMDNQDADEDAFQQMKDKIMKMRRSGLAEGGEFSIENLTFKALRRNGKLNEVMQMINDKLDKQLTLENKMKFDDLCKLLESTLLEKKDHLIKRLKNLSDVEKQQIIDVYTKANWNSKLENMIDWNNPDLTFEDFKQVLNYRSKSGVKKAVKTSGITGLKAGEDYLELKTDGTYQAYRPLNYEASKLIASNKIGGCEGKWCTAYQKDISYWRSYTKKSILVYIVMEDKKKYALLIDKQDLKQYEIWDQEDTKINDDKTLTNTFNTLISNNKDLLNKHDLVQNTGLIDKYVVDNVVDLRNINVEEVLNILIDSKNYLQYTFILPTSCKNMFLENNEIVECGSNWDTSNVTNMSNMFKDAVKAEPIVSRWNVSNVTDMSFMFSGTVNAKPDVSKWNVSSVTDMSFMFSDTQFINPDVTNWNVSNVTNMFGMFSNTQNANPDVSKWIVSSVTDMSYMFNYATMADPDVSKWNVSKVSSMFNMFSYSYTNPDVSEWNVSNVEDMSYMFSNNKVANPDVSKWDVSNVEDMSYMFNYAVVANPDVSEWDVSNVEDVYSTFNNTFSATKAMTDIVNWMQYENISNKYKTIDELKKQVKIGNRRF